MSFDEETVQKVWEKGTPVPGIDSRVWRKDKCGAWITREKRDEQKNLGYGWHVDHISPDGGDGLSNLQPLQWENNLEKSDGRLTCKVTSRGNENVYASGVRQG